MGKWLDLFPYRFLNKNPPSSQGTVTLEDFMSFKHECNYLSGLVIDYKKKLKDPFWTGFEDFFIESIRMTERKLYLIKEQELCDQLISTKTTNTISQCLSIQEN